MSRIGPSWFTEPSEPTVQREGISGRRRTDRQRFERTAVRTPWHPTHLGVVAGTVIGHSADVGVRAAPEVTVAIPVFNGEAFVAEAVRSVLDQSRENLELIVSDNASTDRTAEVVRDAARGDRRVRYLRNAENVGAAPNFNRTVHLARGEFFKWLAADEFVEPTFVERCLLALRERPDAVLACSSYVGHDDLAGRMVHLDVDLSLEQPAARDRFCTLLGRRTGLVLPIWGLQRTATMRSTGLIRPIVRGDHVYMAEMAMRGRFIQLGERLHHIRTHEGAYHRVYGRQRTDSIEEARWFDTSNSKRFYLPHWRRLGAYLGLVHASDAPVRHKLQMERYLLGPFAYDWLGPLCADVVIAAAGVDRYRFLRSLVRRDAAAKPIPI